MTVQQILKLLDPKNQNLPKIGIDSGYKKYNRINVFVLEGKEKDVVKQFPCLKNAKISGKAKELKEVICKNQVFWVHGLGKEDKMTTREIRRLFGRVYLGALAGKPEKIVITCPLDWCEFAATGIRVAALDAGLLKPKYKNEGTPEVILLNFEFGKKSAEARKMISVGEITADGKNLMRMLGAIPPNILTPPKYAEVIKALAKEWKVECKQVSHKELAEYGLINAVAAGSQYSPELLVLTMHPKSGKTAKATALVGKGLCFDSGGLQGKGSYMKDMKLDMSGGASALGTILDIVKNKRDLKETTYFVLPLVESLMGSKAMRPDDIVTAGDGQTVEVIHTDAEGRMVLADAICYMKKNHKDIHKYMTIATLTGSCVVALGDIYTGIICNDDGLKTDVENAADESGDFVHAAPWDEEFDDNNSPVADVANLGEKDRDAGWIKGGMFMSRFLPKKKDGDIDAKYCHFDIAGTIDMKLGGKSWRKKGLSSGVGVGLLSRLLTK